MNQKESEKENVDGVIQVTRAIFVVLAAIAIGYFVYTTTVHTDSKYPFKLGLDLAGGSHLVYEADVSSLNPDEVPELMNVLREVIERRVNVFGVSEQRDRDRELTLPIRNLTHPDPQPWPADHGWQISLECRPVKRPASRPEESPGGEPSRNGRRSGHADSNDGCLQRIAT